MVHFKLPKSKAEKTSVEYPEAGKKRPMVHLKVKPNAELASKPKPKIKLKLKANQRQKSNSQVSTSCGHVVLRWSTTNVVVASHR
jgi:hypothetical protein